MPSQALIEPETTVSAEKPLYERDFHSWTQEQASALSEGRLQDLDLANLAEEVASMGKQEFNRLASALRLVLNQMLNWDHQPERRSRSWVTSIRTHRVHAAQVISDNPSLKGRLEDAVDRAYSVARIRAAGETHKPEKAFSLLCPYTLDEIMNRPFEWPEA